MVGRGGCRNGRKDDLSNIKDMYNSDVGKGGSMGKPLS